MADKEDGCYLEQSLDQSSLAKDVEEYAGYNDCYYHCVDSESRGSLWEGCLSCCTHFCLWSSVCVPQDVLLGVIA